MNFPTRLNELRTENNITQSVLAAKLNIKPQTYSAYEKGKITPPADKIQQLATIFGVSIEYLMCQTDIRNTPPAEDISKQIKNLQNSLKSESCCFAGIIMTDTEKRIISEQLKNIIKLMQIIHT